MSDDEQNKVKDWSKIVEEVSDETLEEMAKEANQDQDEGVSGVLDHPSYKALEDKLTATEKKMHDNWDQAMRVSAELDNVRRRAERDVENAHKYGIEKFVMELLPVVDSLEQGLQAPVNASDEGVSTMREGMELTLKLLVDALNKFQVEQINPEGEAFDPQKHEAMSMQDNPDVAPGTVLVVFQKGYLLHGRVLRPARVIVAKGQAKSIDKEV